ncbi:MAG: PAS domain S-box protein [Deltaproteobacteria bacterium]|nr:PAS domain S-box protein [Deltaproteobacteria bacterium]
MQDASSNALRGKLLAMMVLRVVLALGFLSITSWLQIRDHSVARLIAYYPIYAIVAAVGMLTIAYALTLNRVKSLRLFTFLQVTVDIILITVIVYITGGVDSYMHALYPLVVIGAAILLNKRGGLYAASAASISYGVLIDMDFYRMLPLKYKVIGSGQMNAAWEDVFTTVLTNILAYFTIAYLTGYLAEKTAKVERRLEEKEIDFDRLENLNRHIVGSITSGIMTIDEAMRITSFNRAAESITGYSLREVYYKDAREIFPDMLREGAPAAGASVRVEKTFRKKEGDEIYLGFTISDGRWAEAMYIVIFQDLTQLKDMEARLVMNEKLRALGEMSIGIAHEIRNPLASISGSIQVLKDELKLSGDNLYLMDIVVRETDRLNALINDYLLFAKPAKGFRARVDLSELISETVRIFTHCPEAARIKMECRVNERLYVNGDARQLGQVFWNLFVNAAHAMPDGGALAVHSRILPGGRCGIGSGPPDAYTASSAEQVEITVADTGKGIKPEELNRIFDPFYSTKESGTGLGLAIVHRIVETHDGSIEVSSNPSGAVFRITFPMSVHPVEAGQRMLH